MREDHRFDVLRVFETIAHNELVRIGCGHCHDREEFWFRTDFHTEPKTTAVVCNLVDNLVLLVHLDRVHRLVSTSVIIVLDRTLERVVDRVETVLDDVAESEQHGGIDPTLIKPTHDLVQINLRSRFPAGLKLEVSSVVDADIAAPPLGNAVEIRGILSGALIGRTHRISRLDSRGGWSGFVHCEV